MFTDKMTMHVKELIFSDRNNVGSCGVYELIVLMRQFPVFLCRNLNSECFWFYCY